MQPIRPRQHLKENKTLAKTKLIMNSTSNTPSLSQNIRKFIIISMMLFVSSSAVFAGPGNTTRQKSKLANRVKKMVENVNPANNITLSGEAVVFFSVDDKGQVQLKGVFGTNDALIDHVETALDGELIKIDNLDPEQEYQVRLKYQDLR
jgi:hypothetical protein